MPPNFAIVPVEVALDDRLTKMQIKVLIALLSFREKNTDTVWPKRETLSERCGYNIRTISRVTTQLVELGWLVKVGAGGFSKSCEYRITVPELDTVKSEETVPEPETVPGVATVAKPDTTTVSEPGTKRCPNQTPAKNRPRTDHRTDSNEFDFSGWPDLPSEQVWADFKKHRKGRKAGITQTVINQMGKELVLAGQAGYSVDYCLAVQQEAGWTGFRFDWLINREQKNGNASGQRGGTNRLSASDRADEAVRRELARLESVDGGLESSAGAQIGHFGSGIN